MQILREKCGECKCTKWRVCFLSQWLSMWRACVGWGAIGAMQVAVWAVVLPLICLTTFGSYFCFDLPGTIGEAPSEQLSCNNTNCYCTYDLELTPTRHPEKCPCCTAPNEGPIEISHCLDRDICSAMPNGECVKVNTIMGKFHKAGKSLDHAQITALYSAYSYPNMVLALFGGFLIDRIGLRICTLLFILLVSSGQLTQYWLMVVGRVIFGLGGESLTVAQITFCARWFANEGFIALAFAITITFARLGSYVVFNSTPQMALISVDFAVWMGVASCGLSLAAALGLVLVDLYGERVGKVDPVPQGVDIRRIKQFGISLWLLVAICFFSYCAVFPFNSIGKTFFQDKFGIDQQDADMWLSVYIIVSAVGSPICGFVVDKIGWSLMFLLFSAVVLGGVHFLMVFTCLTGVATMAIFGVALSVLGAALWPCVPRVVHKDALGTAYGLMTAVQNSGLATFPLVLGALQDDLKSKGIWAHQAGLLVLGGLAFISVIVNVLLLLWDWRVGTKLNRIPIIKGGEKDTDSEVEDKEAPSDKPTEKDKLLVNSSSASALPS